MMKDLHGLLEANGYQQDDDNGRNVEGELPEAVNCRMRRMHIRHGLCPAGLVVGRPKVPGIIAEVSAPDVKLASLDYLPGMHIPAAARL
jgi:hypothetical protein